MFEKLITGPSREPATPEQLAVFAHFTAPEQTTGSPPVDNLEYLLIETQISAAREHIERLSNFCFLPQVWQLNLDAFPKFYLGQDAAIHHFNIPTPSPFRPDSIELLRYPVQSVASVTYIDTEGNTQTLDAALYDVKGDRIILKVGNVWPATARVQDCVTVTYTAGFDPDGSPAINIPARLQLALLFLSGWYYESRTPVSTEPTYDVARSLKDLLTGFRSSYMAR